MNLNFAADAGGRKIQEIPRAVRAEALVVDIDGETGGGGGGEDGGPQQAGQQCSHNQQQSSTNVRTTS